MTGRASLLIIAAFAITTVACDGGSSDTAIGGTATVDATAAGETSGPPPPATDPPAPAPEGTEAAAEPEVGQAMDWALAASLSGALRQPVAWSGGFAAINFADGDNWSPDSARGELWYSSDGIEWAGALITPRFAQVYALAGHDGDLFALTGDTLDDTTPQTLWRRSDGSGWEEVLTNELMEHIAIGSDRLIAYRQYPFDIVAVYDTATLEQIDFTGLPDLERPEQVPGPGEISMFPRGAVIGLDDGFLASVGWANTSNSNNDRVAWQLLYSADGSTWTAHPADHTDDVVVHHGDCTAPAFDGLNLLTTAWQQPGASWVTDTGIDLQATSPPTIDKTSGTVSGFFNVGEGTIRHSIDGTSWHLLQAPPTWSVLTDIDERGLAEGTILDSEDGLVAIGVHGTIEGFVGLVGPTTEIWITT